VSTADVVPPPERAAPPPVWWHRPVAAGIVAVVRLFGAVPAAIAYRAADLLAAIYALYWLLHDRRGRRVKGYWHNVRIAFRPGGLGPVRPRGHLWAFARHIAWLAVDFCRLHRLTPANLQRHVDLSELPRIFALMREGKGVVFATAHVGVFDVAGYTAALAGLPITSVFRPSPVPGIDAAIQRLRQGSGQIVAAKKNVIWTLRKALQDRGTVGILCDSSSRKGEAFPPFLGTPAATVASPALLHLATGAPIVVVTAQRLGRFRFAIRIWDVIRHPATADRDADVRAILERINLGLSRAVAAAPEQWFWQGRRFKYRPPAEAPGPDGLPPTAEPARGVPSPKNLGNHTPARDASQR
jgi:KDO2-lipid IV(A) lauroyltransferase